MKYNPNETIGKQFETIRRLSDFFLSSTVKWEGLIMDYALLGSRIRQERLRLNMTQEKLAEKIEVTHAYIEQIERAERSVTLDTLVRLASLLEVTIDDLLQDSIEFSNKHYVNKINRILMNRSLDEQQLASEMLELMFSHMAKSTSN